MSLKVYGLDASQPSRSVTWVLRMKNVDFDYVTVMPGSRKAGGSKEPEFLAKLNPVGNVPVLEDDSFVVWESNAILVYLAEKHGWSDLYPTDIKPRALVHQWMNWMHSGSRQFTIATFAPVMRADLKFSPQDIANGLAAMTKAARVLEGALAERDFLVGDSVTLADIAVYADVGQCQDAYTATFDFQPYPNMSRWLARMEKLPAFEESHAMLASISPSFKKKLAKAKAKL